MIDEERDRRRGATGGAWGGAIVVVLLLAQLLAHRLGLDLPGPPDLPDLPALPDRPGWLAPVVNWGKLVLLVAIGVIAGERAQRRRRRSGDAEDGS